MKTRACSLDHNVFTAPSTVKFCFLFAFCFQITDSTRVRARVTIMTIYYASLARATFSEKRSIVVGRTYERISRPARRGPVRIIYAHYNGWRPPSGQFRARRVHAFDTYIHVYVYKYICIYILGCRIVFYDNNTRYY